MFRNLENILKFEMYLDFWEIFEDNTGSRKDVNLATIISVNKFVFMNLCCLKTQKFSWKHLLFLYEQNYIEQSEL